MISRVMQINAWEYGKSHDQFHLTRFCWSWSHFLLLQPEMEENFFNNSFQAKLSMLLTLMPSS